LMQSRNFLPKPYSIYKLAQLIRKCLDEPAQVIAGTEFIS